MQEWHYFVNASGRLEGSFQANGYKRLIIQGIINRRLNHRPNIKEKNVVNSIAFLPYVSEVTYRIGKVLLKQYVKTGFKPAQKVSQLLMSPKG